MNMITQNKHHNKPPLKTMAKIPGQLLILVLAMGFMNTALAQARTLTQDEAIKLGIQNSKTLKLSQSKLDQAVSQYNQVKDRVLPTGSASLTYDRAAVSFSL